MFKVRTFESRTLSWWYQERDQIDFGPQYQRMGGLWGKEDKANLIESILNNFDIPKIYLADFTYADSPLNERQKSYAIIDGRQRLEAIFEFFDGALVLDREFVYAEDPYLNLGGLSLRDLKQRHPRVASKFENFNLSVMSVITDEEAKINELFVRLNTSKPLTGAEVRNAMKGGHPGIIRQLANHEFFRNLVRFRTNRGQALNVSAKLLLIEFLGKFTDTKKVNLDRFVLEGRKAEVDNVRRAADRASKVLEKMTAIFLPKDALLSPQGRVPIYYWLARQVADDWQGILRDFLNNFEASREEFRVRQRQSLPTDTRLAQYELFDRSTNDQSSLEGRWRIMSSLFVDYLSRGVTATV